MGRDGLERTSRKNMVHEGTSLWHVAGFNASRWLMIIIHGYRATTLVLYILLNVLVRTGEYNPLSDCLRQRLFFHELFICVCRQSEPNIAKQRYLRASFEFTVSFCPQPLRDHISSFLKNLISMNLFLY